MLLIFVTWLVSEYSISGDGRILFWSRENDLKHPAVGHCLIPTRKYHGKPSSVVFVCGAFISVYVSVCHCSYVTGVRSWYCSEQILCVGRHCLIFLC